MVELVILFTRGIIRSQHTRRQLMFYVILAAMLMLFAGVTFLQDWLRENLAVLLGYWFVCVSLTLLAALLAIFDLLMLRVLARQEKRRLESRYLRETKPPAVGDEGTG